MLQHSRTKSLWYWEFRCRVKGGLVCLDWGAAWEGFLFLDTKLLLLSFDFLVFLSSSNTISIFFCWVAFVNIHGLSMNTSFLTK